MTQNALSQRARLTNICLHSKIKPLQSRASPGSRTRNRPFTKRLRCQLRQGGQARAKGFEPWASTVAQSHSSQTELRPPNRPGTRMVHASGYRRPLVRCVGHLIAADGQARPNPWRGRWSRGELSVCAKQKRRGRPVAFCARWGFQNQKRDELLFVARVICRGCAARSRRAARGPRPDQAREYRHRLCLRFLTAQAGRLTCFIRMIVVPELPDHRRILKCRPLAISDGRNIGAGGRFVNEEFVNAL